MDASGPASTFRTLRGLGPKSPRSSGGRPPTLKTKGGLSATLDIRGRLPSPWPTRIDWTKPPTRATFGIRADDLDLRSIALGIDLRALTATVTAQLGPNVALLTPRLRADRMAFGPTEARGLRLDGSMGLEDGIWRAVTTARAVEVATKVDGHRVADAASLALSAQYIPKGDLVVERLDAPLPSAGLVASVEGQLRRSRSKRFVPDVKLDAQVDLARLSLFVAALKPGQGRFGAQLEARPGPSNTVRLGGRTTSIR